MGAGGWEGFPSVEAIGMLLLKLHRDGKLSRGGDRRNVRYGIVDWDFSKKCEDFCEMPRVRTREIGMDVGWGNVRAGSLDFLGVPSLGY